MSCNRRTEAGRASRSEIADGRRSGKSRASNNIFIFDAERLDKAKKKRYNIRMPLDTTDEHML